jgi:ribose 5-phosphate isomerase B
MGRPLISEKDIVAALKQGLKVLSIEPNAIITAAAQESAQKHNITFSIQKTIEDHQAIVSPKKSLEKTIHKDNEKFMVIAIGSDHGGFSMKELLKSFLIEQGHKIIDVGTDSEKACDYPDFAYSVASLVSVGKADRGIMIDGIGVASSIVANKVPGIRAVPCNNEFAAHSSREHNNANVLTLGGRITEIVLAKSIAKIWLETPFSGGRHQQRVEKINDIENRFMKPS